MMIGDTVEADKDKARGEQDCACDRIDREGHGNTADGYYDREKASYKCFLGPGDI